MVHHIRYHAVQIRLGNAQFNCTQPVDIVAMPAQPGYSSPYALVILLRSTLKTIWIENNLTPGQRGG